LSSYLTYRNVSTLGILFNLFRAVNEIHRLELPVPPHILMQELVLKMEAARTSETSASYRNTTQRHNPEYST